jgi:RNA polymerase-binding transcription factor DksA
MADNKKDDRTDVSLCFQALGLEFGAPPEDVEKAYQRMLAEIKRKQSSPDPAKRSEAAGDLELAHDLYEKIRNSITYNTRLREAEHLSSLKEQTKKEPVQQYKICPSCKKTIVASLKKCPFCREPIRTPFEMFMHRYLTGRNLVLIIILILVIIAAVVVLMNPDLINLLTGAKGE